MTKTNESESEITYETCVRRMILWRNVQSIILLAMILLPSFLYLNVQPGYVATGWSITMLLFWASHIRRVHYRNAASRLAP